MKELDEVSKLKAQVEDHGTRIAEAEAVEAQKRKGYEDAEAELDRVRGLHRGEEGHPNVTNAIALKDSAKKYLADAQEEVAHIKANRDKLAAKLVEAEKAVEALKPKPVEPVEPPKPVEPVA